MKPRGPLARGLSLGLALAGFVLSSGCGVMFGNVEDECSGSCTTINDCPISACGCVNNVARVGISCSSAGGCCLAEGYVCDRMCEGHGGVAKIEKLSCTPISDCNACSTPTCNCWNGSATRGGCASNLSGALCCLSGVTDWKPLCHGLCADYGGLKSVTP